ncbi:exocyst complex component Sec3-domain-containing protein [Desarmillaria tabescens]|uniref:Exocyst complex component Sec3-domain-containing protein n=1 Tax=Armillaria tabescens TaxID=1929756 RepID=A0AA39TNE3_ARMTA|nr:exocyst complex component Sec3-domain-containing protein [Desarmillaria tabescens]KAK0464997.1 exocyst complex component Sec3-domain-containing protein [Desarmillaria tabescens]
MTDQRQRIIDSVFSRRNASGSIEESYVSHIKILEDSPETGGTKPRYILLSQTINGNGFLHKSKLNTNGTFSVGKTWRLPELRAVQVTSAQSFNITLSRTYRWRTENAADQVKFLEALIPLFHTVTGGKAPLQVEGFPSTEDVPQGRQRIQNDYMRTPRTPSPSPYESSSIHQSLASAIPPTSSRTLSQSQSDRDHEPMQPSGSQSRSARPASPAHSNRSHPSSVRIREPSSSRPRPSSPAYSQTSSIPSAPGRSAFRQSASSATTAQQYVQPSRPTQSARPARDVRDSPTSSVIPPADDRFTLAAAPSQASRSRPTPSPAPSNRKQSTRAATILIAADGSSSRRDNTRVSFFDPANQVTIDRLIGSNANEVEGEEENAQATMANVEEMIEGYEWASEDIIGRKTARGAAEMIEARLLDELMALEKANIHSFLESDDRIGIVLKYMDEAITELDSMGSLIQSYKIHLNAVGDDISYIQSQNRGLQVQTQNQHALLAELENLLQTVQVDKEVLLTLTQDSLRDSNSIQRIEEAAAELYKALQAGRDTDMAATMERLQEYRTHNAQFCKRIFDYLSIMFSAQAKLLLGDSDGLTKTDRRGIPTINLHTELENYLGRYSGLMLYLKEMDEAVYAKLCAAYFSALNDLHGTQIRAMLSSCLSLIKKASEEDQEQGIGSVASPPISRPTGIKRAGTLIRSPLESRRDKDKSDGTMRSSEVLGLALEQIAPTIYHEEEFITDFLQINDAALTFADYMGLDNYFRRQAARSASVSQTTMKLVRGALDLIFSFLPSELKTWLDNALAKDKAQIFGLIACLERFLADADDRGNNFFIGLLEKQHTRLKGLLERHVSEQIQGVEQTKLTSKKRKGVAPFVRLFPGYIGRVESQLLGTDGLEVRTIVDGAYERIVDTMFECLKQMAKMDGEGEDKGQLNYHVILIENMHHFVAEISQMEIGSVAGFLRKAEAIYDENLGAYVKIILRRPFAKIIDYFEGVERLLKTTAPSEIATNSSYNRSALKKVVKEYSAKDIRKHIDALFKRVEKHFTEASEKTTTEESGGIAPGTVMVGVWKACEEELLRITELFSKRISQCYPDSGVSLDYTSVDVEAAFRRHRVGGA